MPHGLRHCLASLLLVGCSGAQAAPGPESLVLSLDAGRVLEGPGVTLPGLDEAMAHLLAACRLFDALHSGDLRADTLLPVAAAPARSRLAEHMLRDWLRDGDPGLLQLLSDARLRVPGTPEVRPVPPCMDAGLDGGRDPRALAQLVRRLLQRHPTESLLFPRRGAAIELLPSGAALQLLALWPEAPGSEPALLVMAARRPSPEVAGQASGAGSVVALLEQARRRYSRVSVSAGGQMLLKPRVWASAEGRVPVGTAETFQVTLQAGQVDRLERQATLHSPLQAPLAIGTTVGELRITLDGAELGRAPLVALADAREAPAWIRWRDRVGRWLAW